MVEFHFNYTAILVVGGSALHHGRPTFLRFFTPLDVSLCVLVTTFESGVWLFASFLASVVACSDMVLFSLFSLISECLAY